MLLSGQVSAPNAAPARDTPTPRSSRLHADEANGEVEDHEQIDRRVGMAEQPLTGEHRRVDGRVEEAHRADGERRHAEELVRVVERLFAGEQRPRRVGEEAELRGAVVVLEEVVRVPPFEQREDDAEHGEQPQLDETLAAGARRRCARVGGRQLAHGGDDGMRSRRAHTVTGLPVVGARSSATLA